MREFCYLIENGKSIASSSIFSSLTGNLWTFSEFCWLNDNHISDDLCLIIFCGEITLEIF